MRDPSTYLTREDATMAVKGVVDGTTYPDTKFDLQRSGDWGLVLWVNCYHRANSVCPNGGLTALKQHVTWGWTLLCRFPSEAKLEGYIRRSIERLIRDGEDHEVSETLKFGGVPVAWPHGEGAPTVPKGLGISFEDAVRQHQTSKCDACTEAAHYEAHDALLRARPL